MSRAARQLIGLALIVGLTGCVPGSSVTPDPDGGGSEGEGEGEGGRDLGPGEDGGCRETDETCDGIDDDCDGETDEDYVEDASCGVGYCRDTNWPSHCNEGRESACQLGVPLNPADRTCDGVDDNCNGLVDEDYHTTKYCGQGVCRRDAVCVGGEEVCTEGTGSEEVCDSEDNDCDGETDEGQVCGDCVGIPSGQVIAEGPWGPCGSFEDSCDEVGTQSRTLTVCRAEEISHESEDQTCRRETDGDPCPEGRCENGVCDSAAPCPDPGDGQADAIPGRVERTSRHTGAICMRDNFDDRYRVTLQPGATVHLELVLDAGVTDTVRLWLYDNGSYQEPPIQGGESGLLSMDVRNDTGGELRYYLLIYNVTQSQDVGYVLRATFGE